MLAVGYATGLQIQRIQELGLQIPVAVCRLYTLNKYIWLVGVANPNDNAQILYI